MYLRETLEELGPGFVKLGQSLSAYDIPRAIRLEFKKLLDRVRPLPLNIMRPIIEEALAELGLGTLDERYESVDQTPIGSASLAQVYCVTVRGHQKRSVIKALRPDTQVILLRRN